MSIDAFFAWTTWTVNSNFIGLFIVIPAAVFAGIMSWWARENHESSSFSTYLYEGVTIEASVIILISAFNKSLFEAIGDNKVFLMIVAFMTLSYALRDLIGRSHRARSVVGADKAKRQDF